MYRIEIVSNNSDQTLKIGKIFASRLNNGDIIVLTGELGAGKTKFVEGVLQNFGLENEISSPTFTIINEYTKKDINIYHFDAYRLEDSDEFYAIGGEEYFEKGICLIEWGELISDVLPNDYIHININKSETDENERKICFEVKDNSKYINVLNKLKEALN